MSRPTPAMEEVQLLTWPTAGAFSAMGPRESQEDSAGAAPEAGVYAVADGVSSGGGGDVAALVAVEAVTSAAPATLRTLPNPAVAARVLGAKADIAVRQAQMARVDGCECKTTLALLVLGATEACVAWAGDSRVYLLREGTLAQLTDDHRMPGHRHAITRCLGSRHVENSDVDLRTLPVQPGDVYLLATDGVGDTLAPEVLAKVLCRVGRTAGGGQRRLVTPTSAAVELVDMALKQGSKDNSTALVVYVPGGGR